MPLFHFDCGDSNKGTIGFCAAIKAGSKAEALMRLQELLPSDLDAGGDDLKQGEYINVYFGEENITEDNIDEEEKSED